MQTSVRNMGTINRDPRTGRFVKTFTLSYEKEEGIVTRTLPAAGIERVGSVVARLAERETVWNVAVFDKDGEDVTFEFRCFQD
ncbi:hypothetical protein [Streptomyces cyaneofuscatus]